jgi:phosphohistidine phosphatase SixA
LVGHEPYLSELISMLLSGTTDLSINFKKAGLCKLTVEHLRLGPCATLEWLVSPKLLI